VYAIIHSVPWFKFERDEFGKVYISEYFMKGQRRTMGWRRIHSLSLDMHLRDCTYALSKVDQLFLIKNSLERIAIMVILGLVFVLDSVNLNVLQIQITMVRTHFHASWSLPNWIN